VQRLFVVGVFIGVPGMSGEVKVGVSMGEPGWEASKAEAESERVRIACCMERLGSSSEYTREAITAGLY
jgi:hypothetical protein